MAFLTWGNAIADAKSKALARPEGEIAEDFQRTISSIFNAVVSMGDKALFDLTYRLDKVKLDDLVLNLDDLDTPSIIKADKEAIQQAAKNIRTFHQAQLPEPIKIETMSGVFCEKQWRAIETVGLYIPGGSAPLISTLLMLVIPAQIAGVKNIVLCTPPQKGVNIINPHILWTAKWLGIKTFYTLGGAQAIAAMTFGTDTVPKVAKIFGPGNIWVTGAKRYASCLAQGPAIDMPAGPSEVMVVADLSADPAIIAADLLGQAEHDTLSQTVLVSFSKLLIREVKKEVETQLNALSRVDITRAAMKNARFIFVATNADAVDVINQYAPEHLILNMENPNGILPDVNNAGSIFIGPFTPETVGDYASGTNHVLPTGGFARSYSGLGTTSFMKSMTLQTLTQEGLETLGHTVERLARLEGLDAHANSVKKRLALLNAGKNHDF